MPEEQYFIPDFGRVLLRLPDMPTLVSLQSYVPGLYKLAGGLPRLSIIYNQLQSQVLLHENDVLTLGGEWSLARRDDVPHLLYAIARKHWIENGSYPIHAAAVVGSSGKAILLAGPSGVGKTTLCDALVGAKAGLFLSGNKTLLSLDPQKMLAVESTRTRSVLQPDGSREQMQVGLDVTLPVPVGAIVLPYLNDEHDSWRQLSQRSALHSLFPLCLDTANADVLVDDGKAVFDGSIHLQARQTLSIHLASVLSTLPVYRGVGSLSFLRDKIGGLP